MKVFTPSPPMQALLEQMSHDMAVPVEGLVNQALFNWAKLHGYVEPGRVASEAPPISAPPTTTVPVAHPLPVEAAAVHRPAPPPEPDTARVPVVDAPDDGEWKIVTGGTFAPPAEEPSERTVPKQARAKRLVLLVGDRVVPVDVERFLIGRDATCHLTIDAPRVSRQHAVVHVGLQGAELQDLGSSNGTWFEGERIERRVLQHGDVLHFGDSEVRVELR